MLLTFYYLLIASGMRGMVKAALNYGLTFYYLLIASGATCDRRSNSTEMSLSTIS